jgi:hypothetical protein
MTDASLIEQAIQAKLNRVGASQSPEEITAAAVAAASEIVSTNVDVVEETTTKRKRRSVEERAAAKLVLDQARAERQTRKEAKLALEQRVPHVGKLAKAESKLPQLSNKAQIAFNELTVSLSNPEISALIAHFMHYNRATSIINALKSKERILTYGQNVEIIGGDARYIGKSGVITKTGKIKCHVDIGLKNPIYVFVTDVLEMEIDNDEIADDHI